MTSSLLRALLVFGFLVASPVWAQDPAPIANPDLDLLHAGEVYAIARQPDGGLVFGGYFRSVNGVPRSNIARLLPDGTLDPDWNPSAQGASPGSPGWDPVSHGAVRALAVDDSGSVFAGGDFTSIGGLGRLRIAKLSGAGAGGADPGWNPSASGTVFSLATGADAAVFAGGSFVTIGGESRPNLARLSGSGSGAADPAWNAVVNGRVHAIVLDASGDAYVGGQFTSAGGQSRMNIAKVAGISGALDARWNPSADDRVFALALDGSGAIYVGGNFGSIGGRSRNFLARLDTSGTGAADATWNPAANGYVNALAVEGSSSLIVGGAFGTIGGQPRTYLARISRAGIGAADPSWNPSPNQIVHSVSLAGDGSLHVGGAFSTIGAVPRLGLSSVGGAGVIGQSVDAELRIAYVNDIAVQPDGGTIVGGQFHKANGLSRQNLLRLNPDGSLDASWNPAADQTVNAVVVDGGGSVYVGGRFRTIGGVARRYIAKVAGSGSGVVDALWNPTANDYVTALALHESTTVYAGGAFSEIGGQPRSGIAKLSASASGLADPDWQAWTNSSVETLAVDATGWVYAGGHFTIASGQARNHIARFAQGGAGALDLTWNPNANASVYTLALDSDGFLFAGGQFSIIGGLARGRLAKLSGIGIGAAVADWNVPASAFVSAIAIDRSGAVIVGGDFSSIGGWSRQRVAKVSATSPPVLDLAWNPSPNGRVDALAIGPEGRVTAGGIFTVMGSQARRSLAALPGPRYSLNYAAGANGALAGATSQSLVQGGSGTPVTALPAANHHFVEWSDGATANPRVDSDVLASVDVTAIFAIDQYTLTYMAGPNGSIIGESPQTVAHGGSGSAITAVPASHHHFVQWSDGATDNLRTDDNVIANVTVTATFAVDTYSLTPVSGKGGSLVLAAGQSFPLTAVPHGSAVLFDVLVETGHRVVSVSGCGGALDGAVYVTAPVVGSCTVDARFNRNPIAQPGALQVLEDASASEGFLVADDDDAGLSFQLVAEPLQGTVEITNPATGAYRYTPDMDANGVDSFSFIVSDGDVDSSEATVGIAITAVNDAPSFGLDASPSHPASSSGPQHVVDFASFSAGPPDEVTSQSIEDYLIGPILDPDHILVADSLDISNDGHLDYVLTGTGGVAIVTLRARDTGDTANGGQNASPPRDFEISVGRSADLEVEMLADRTQAQPGEGVIYSITVANAGPNALTGGALSDVLPPALLGDGWACMPAQSTAPCPLPPHDAGEDDLTAIIDLAPGQHLTYLLATIVQKQAGSTVVNSVSIAPPAGITDPQTANNLSAVGVLIVPEGIFGSGFEALARPMRASPTSVSTSALILQPD